MKKQALYNIVSCNEECITLQANNKLAIFNLDWKEALLPENLISISNEQLFFLGTYYSHNKRNLNLDSILSYDPEIVNVSKLILSEFRENNFILMDVKSKKIETLSKKFILTNLEILDEFTSMQAFFLGIRVGVTYDKSNIYEK